MTQPSEPQGSSQPPVPPIAALRAALGITQEEFGALIGLKTKGSVSLVERGLAPVSADVALAIEELSDGTIDASDLNPIIAKARGVDRVGNHADSDTAKLEETPTGQCAGLSGEAEAGA
ncbi:helix-turn-helix domain-containing protein [Novosphingobium sp.]|uniref:helix-turn-helix domain-containing protein n=1 Tax=Novosphingobium sp. TaxID=1874826 RepID=UPI0038B76F91